MLDDFIRLVARICLAGVFLYDGYIIVSNYQGAVAYAAGYGVPSYLLPPVTALQLGGGLLLIAGWLTRLVALALALFCLSTATLFHADFAKSSEIIQFGKDIGLAGGFLLLYLAGPGRYSIDGGAKKR